MPHQDLLDNLRQLQQQLPREQEPDAETRALLERVAAEIQAMLHSADAKPETPATDDSPGEQLRMALLGFEARHPQLSALIERITDGLASMGI